MYRLKILGIILTFFSLICSANDGSPLEKEEPIKFVIGDYPLSPSAGEYDDWNNFQVHSIVRNIPDEFDIELDGYTHPLKGEHEFLSPYGKRIARNHYGVDIRATLQDTVYAAFDGKVRYSSYNTGGYGYVIVIRHYNGLETYYAHLSRLMVFPNEYVNSGQPIGMAGTTGRSSCVHLHFETRLCGKAINPEELIDFKNSDVLYDVYKFLKNNGNGQKKVKRIRKGRK